jgi:uncharacterized membrane protein YbhN (UPF0104 family)
MAEGPSPDQGAGLARSATVRLIGIGISLVSLGAVAWWAARQPPPTLPSAPGELMALLAAIVVYGCATAVRGERAYRLLRATGAEAGRGDCWALTAVSYMGNNVLPARGGDAIRAYLQAPRARTSIRNVVGTMIAERLLDAITLLSLFALLAYLVLRGIDAPEGGTLAIVAGALAAAGAILGLAAWLLRNREPARRLLAWLAPLGGSTAGLRGAHGARMLLLTLAIWSLEAATYLTVSAAVELDMDPVEALYLVALASVFVLIPSGPGYAGTLDAAVLFGVDAIGGTGGEAVSYLLVLRFVLLVPITLAGLALLVSRYGGLDRLRRAEPSRA